MEVVMLTRVAEEHRVKALRSVTTINQLGDDMQWKYPDYLVLLITHFSLIKQISGQQCFNREIVLGWSLLEDCRPSS
jgi:glutamate racemase